MHNGELVSAAARAQLYGLLAKKNSAGQSGSSTSKWSKR